MHNAQLLPQSKSQSDFDSSLREGAKYLPQRGRGTACGGRSLKVFLTGADVFVSSDFRFPRGALGYHPCESILSAASDQRSALTESDKIAKSPFRPIGHLPLKGQAYLASPLGKSPC